MLKTRKLTLKFSFLLFCAFFVTLFAFYFIMQKNRLPSLLRQLQDFTEEAFKDITLTPEESVRISGASVMSEIRKNGFALRNHLSDKEARSVFVTIQTSAERKAIDHVAKITGILPAASVQAAVKRKITERLSATKDEKIAKSIWIIHTPTIATPCVTVGSPTPQLLAEEIMNNPVLKSLTLSRANIIRDYLKAGGILIVAYDKAQRQEVIDPATKAIVAKGRTADQVAIFEQLKAAYPKQIIDFPIDLKSKQEKLKLATASYPLDMIGATYLMEDTFGKKFEMTNLGVQANDPRNDATWGVWMQNRSEAVPEVTQRMAIVFSFLQNAGLNQVLNTHAQRFGIDPDEFSPLLSRYMSLEVGLAKSTDCKVQ